MINNIEEILKGVKLRPQMYVGEEVTLERLSLYISGFLAGRYGKSGMDPVDHAFKDQFHQWVRDWAVKNYGDEFDFPSGWGYVEHIGQICKKEEERLKLFFELAEKFFMEIKGNREGMEYDLQNLQKKIIKYFAGELSKKDLGVWCEKAEFDLLKGGYFLEVRKIALIPFLKTISKFHIERNDLADEYPCTEEEVKEIQSILNGEKTFCYQMEMGISAYVYERFPENSNFDVKKRDLFAEIKEEVLAYQDMVEISFSESKILGFIHSFSPIKGELETVQGMLEKEIWKLCMVLFDKDSVELERKSLTIMYPVEKRRDRGVEKLIEYLDCYLGNRNFNVVLTLEEGEAEVVLLV